MNKLEHVAIIMDGNGRWAKRHHRERTFGHLQGVENVRNIAIKANDMGVRFLTLYAFSTENWSRPIEEVDYLMKLPALFFKKFLSELMAKDIRIAMIGDWERIPKETQKILKDAIAQTAKNNGMTLVFAMNYGGKQEIVKAAVRYAEAVKSQADTAPLDVDGFERYLMSGDYPDVDLMIRTSGECRLSNFLLWKIAYAELVFVSEDWPDFTPNSFEQVVGEYQKRDRRFGGLQ